MNRDSDILIILNPNASKGEGLKKKTLILSAFEKRGVSVDLIETKAPYDAINIASEGSLSGYKTIVAAGGDGTANEVANGILRSGKDISMGIIPVGRGNDFAFIADIPTSIDEAVDLILNHEAREMDVGYLEGGDFPQGRYFLNGAGIGFEPSVTFKASQMKHLNGTPSYVIALLSCLIHLPRPCTVTLTIDGVSKEINTQQISMCNGRRMGSAFIMGPDAVINDGVLDIMYAPKPITRRELLTLLVPFIKGIIKKSPLLSFAKGKCIKVVSSKADLVIHLDGEKVSYGCSECSVSIKSSALKMHYRSFAN